MLYEVKGTCSFCKNEYKVVIVEGEQCVCQNCAEIPVKIKKFAGLIYIITNPNQRGVKVGLTTKDIQTRLRQLNSTGVAGLFNVVAIFPSHNPKRDEEKAHTRLWKYHLDKEHFDTDAITAVLRVHAVLKRDPIFYDSAVGADFWIHKEENKKKMIRRLAGVPDPDQGQDEEDPSERLYYKNQQTLAFSRKSKSEDEIEE